MAEFSLLVWLILAPLCLAAIHDHSLTTDGAVPEIRRPNDAPNITIDGVDCLSPAIEQFPRLPLHQSHRAHGALILHVLIAIYCATGIIIICEDYFIPSLEVLMQVLKLNADVAGATFMAAGGCAPALATTIIGVFVMQVIDHFYHYKPRPLTFDTKCNVYF